MFHVKYLQGDCESLASVQVPGFTAMLSTFSAIQRPRVCLGSVAPSLGCIVGAQQPADVYLLMVHSWPLHGRRAHHRAASDSA